MQMRNEFCVSSQYESEREMRKFRLIFLLFLLRIAPSYQKTLLDLLLNPCKQCKCGIPNREAKLLGGEYTRGHEFPWLVGIFHMGLPQLTGSLISDLYVLTSATPILHRTPPELKVVTGQFDRCFPDVSSTNHSVDRIHVHPDYNPGNRANDLAILKLSAPVIFERRIGTICLPTPGSSYLGQVVTLVGWSESKGALGELVSSCRPRKLGLPVLGERECLGSSFDPGAVSADKGCAGVVGVPGVVCQIDVGGPVMYRSYGGVYELVGVLSDRNSCGPKASSALYTRVGLHLRWISDVATPSCFCRKT